MSRYARQKVHSARLQLNIDLAVESLYQRCGKGRAAA